MYLKRLGFLLLDLGVALLAIAAAVAAYRLGVMALIERLLPSNESLVTAVRRVGVVSSALLAYWVVARHYERRDLGELAFRPLATALGALSGIALIGLTIASLFALGFYQLVSYRGWGPALPILATIALAVVFEEILFRGVLFRLLEKHTGTLRALVVESLFFGVLHMFNDGVTIITVVSVTLIGAFWTLIYIHSRNLWVLAAHHAAWNITIFVSGVPLSGQEEWIRSAPFESLSRGPGWLTGGDFGPEDSILNLVVVAGALAALGYRVWRQRHSMVRPPIASRGA